MSIEYDKLREILGNPSVERGGKAYWQCPLCYQRGGDTRSDNLVFDINKNIFWCFASAGEHNKEILKGMGQKNQIKSFNPTPAKVQPEYKCTITKEDVMKANNNLINDEKMLEQLAIKRGLSLISVEDCKIGFTDDHKWLFPCFGLNNKLLGCEYRPIDFDSKGITKSVGVSARSFCKINFPKSASNLIVTEGFLDGYALYEYLKFHNQHKKFQIVTPSCGIATLKEIFSNLDPKRYHNIYLFIDNDQPSEDVKEAISLTVTWQYRQLNLPCDCCKDMNDWFLKHDYSENFLNNFITINKQSFSTLETKSNISEITKITLEAIKAPRLYLGFNDIDQLLNGIRLDEIVTLCGPPGMGKTSVMLNFALQMALNKVRPAILSLEMSIDQILMRLITILSQDNALVDDLKRKDTELTERILEAFAPMLEKLNIKICDECDLSPAGIETLLTKNWDIDDIDIVFIDYLDLVFPEDERPDNQYWIRIKDVLQKILTMAKTYKKPFFILQQPKRRESHMRNKRLTMSDIKGGGAVEQISSKILLLHREGYYNTEEEEITPEQEKLIEINVTKNRFGTTGRVQMNWDGRLYTISEMDKYVKQITQRWSK